METLTQRPCRGWAMSSAPPERRAISRFRTSPSRSTSVPCTCQAIEDEDWTEIAAPVYVRGFIRTYARFLGLDQEEAVRRYNAVLGEGAYPSQIVVPSMASGGSGPSVWVWLAGAAALILVGFVVYNYYQFQAGARGSGGPTEPLTQQTFAAAVPLD